MHASARAVRIGAAALVAVPLLFSIGPAPLLAATPIDGGAITILPVTINATAGDQFDPHVSGDLVSYTAGTRIRYYDFGTGNDYELLAPAGSQDLLSDVSNGRIAFSRVETSGQIPVEVFDLGSNKTAEVDLQANPLQLSPGFGGDTVAFIDQAASPEGELVISRLAGSTTQITTDTRVDQSPQVSPNGNVVVYESCGTDCDIHQAVWGGSSWSGAALTTTTDQEHNPDTDGTTVVYDAVRAGQRDICWQPVGGGTEQCLSLPGDQRDPSVAAGVVLFESVAVGDSTADLFAYEIATNRMFRITSTAGVDESLNDITRLTDGRYRIVWSSGTEPDRDVYGATFTLPPAGYGFGGFTGPVDALPTLNQMKAGAAVPVKFSLGGDFGLSIFASGYPKSQSVACDATAPVDGIEQTVTAGGSSLQYDPTSGLYTYIWKTDKAWVGTCRQLVIGFADGSFARANFKFK